MGNKSEKKFIKKQKYESFNITHELRKLLKNKSKKEKGNIWK